MKRTKTLAIIFLFLLSFSCLVIPAIADDKKTGDDTKKASDDSSTETKDIKITKNEKIWKDKKSGITAIDPTETGGIVTSSLEITIDGISFIYTNYSDFIMVPGDGIPSMVLIFNKGSIESTLYIDDDAKQLLDEKNSKIEITGVDSLNIKESDLKKNEGTELYTIEVKDNNGKKNLKNALENELATGSKLIRPRISNPDSNAEGSIVIIKESKGMGFSDIRSINDFMLWINLKFSMNLNNKEKEIFQEGILKTLEKTVEDCTTTIPGSDTQTGQAITENTCIAVTGE